MKTHQEFLESLKQINDRFFKSASDQAGDILTGRMVDPFQNFLWLNDLCIDLEILIREVPSLPDESISYLEIKRTVWAWIESLNSEPEFMNVAFQPKNIKKKLEAIIDLIDEEVQRLREKGINQPVEEQPSSTNFQLEWTGKKYELCELIKALMLSERVRIEGQNSSIKLKDLIELFSSMFPDMKLTDNNFYDILRKGYNVQKRQTNNRFFINELNSKFLSELMKLIKDDSVKKKNS